MRTLTEYILALADLVEAEARAIRRGLFRLVVAVMVLLVAGALMLLGLGMVLYGLYHGLLSAGMSVPGAAALAGVIFVAGAGLLIGGASWLKK